MTKSLFDYSGLFITSLGTIFGGVGIYLAASSDTTLTSLNWLLIFVSILCLLLVLIFLRSSSFNKRYREAYHLINLAFTSVNELYENENKIKDLAATIEALECFCSNIKKTFQLLTGKNCSTSIKLFELGQNNEICTVTFCRDAESRISEIRINPEDDKIIHYLRDNTDFEFIFDNIEEPDENYKSYYSNYLPFEDFYKNTRIDYKNFPPKNRFPIIKEILRLSKWPLPYKSTIVVPITLFLNKKIIEGKIAGFLCVDSPNLGAFNKRSDTEIMRGIADGIFTTIKTINEIHFQNIHQKINHKPKHKSI